eukprot:m.302307 g.302307  ORF g.302307 m.302307 type:complete len:84 (-) comp20143_c1_seq11:1872-2123(-)
MNIFSIRVDAYATDVAEMVTGIRRFEACPRLGTMAPNGTSYQLVPGQEDSTSAVDVNTGHAKFIETYVKWEVLAMQCVTCTAF